MNSILWVLDSHLQPQNESPNLYDWGSLILELMKIGWPIRFSPGFERRLYIKMKQFRDLKLAMMSDIILVCLYGGATRRGERRRSKANLGGVTHWIIHMVNKSRLIGQVNCLQFPEKLSMAGYGVGFGCCWPLCYHGFTQVLSSCREGRYGASKGNSIISRSKNRKDWNTPDFRSSGQISCFLWISWVFFSLTKCHWIYILVNSRFIIH